MAEPKDFIDLGKIKDNSLIFDTKGLPFTNKFYCEVAFNNTGIATYEEIFNFQLISADVPNFGIDAVEMELNGARRSYFKSRNDMDLGITFIDTPDLKLRLFFYNWMATALNVTNSGVYRDYMKNYADGNIIKIYPLDFNEEKGTVCDKFEHVYPIDVSGISYNYSDDFELIKTTVKFRYLFHTLE